MLLLKITSTFFIIFFFTITGHSQSPWFNSLPMYYNPSYAGSSGKLNLNSNFRFWSNNSTEFINTKSRAIQNDISIDHFIPKIKSGVGIILNYGNGYKKSTYFNDNSYVYDIGLSLAPKFSIAGKITISPSILFKYSNFNSEKSIIEFDEHNGRRPVFYDYQTQSLRFISGFLINSKKFQMGISTTILERIPLLNSNIHLFNTYLNLGYNFCRSEEAKFSFTPVILINFPSRKHITNPISGDFDYLQRYFGAATAHKNIILVSSIFLNFRLKSLLFGLGYEDRILFGYHTGNFSLLAGYQQNRWRLMAIGSYSKRAYDSDTKIQLSIRYQFGSTSSFSYM